MKIAGPLVPGIDNPCRFMDNDDMTTVIDSERRIVLPTGNPGDKFDVRRLEDGSIVLMPVLFSAKQTRWTRSRCIQEIDQSPLLPRMDWETLRAVTRDL